MLKSQDCIILIKLLANPGKQWSQRELSQVLCISLAEVNAGIRRLKESRLLNKTGKSQFIPILQAAEEFLINDLKYFFPAKLGEYTRGVPTAVGAPLFRGKIMLGRDPIPIWPDALGEHRGIALTPIHSSVPKALRQSPDQNFHELLVLIDAIRAGRARERNMAVMFLKERLNEGK